MDSSSITNTLPDGEYNVRTFYADGTVETQTGYTATGVVEYVNTYFPNGTIFEQTGYNLSGQVSGNIITAPDNSRTVISDYMGEVQTQTGYDDLGRITYINHYDQTGQLYEQDGYSAVGGLAADIYTASDGSQTIRTFSGSAEFDPVLTQVGYDTSGHEVYQNTYDPEGDVASQTAYYPNGEPSVAIYINTAGYGNQTAHFDQTGAETYSVNFSFRPSDYYSIKTYQPDLVLTTPPAFNEFFELNNPNTTVALAAGFGMLTIDGFVASGSGQDEIRVPTSLAADYSHLISLGQDTAYGAMFTFNSHDSMTLQNLHIAQLNSSDFLFV